MTGDGAPPPDDAAPDRGDGGAPRDGAGRRPPDQSDIHGISTIASLPDRPHARRRGGAPRGDDRTGAPRGR